VTDSTQLTAREVIRVVRVNGNGAFAVHTPHDIGTTGTHMAYWEHLPTHYSDDPNQTFPLIVFIHGWGHARFLDSTDEQVPLSDLENVNFDGIFNGAYATWDNSRPFIVLSPQKCVDALTYGATAYRMKLFIDYAVNTYQVDPTRIYLGGHSEGSGDTWDYVTNYPIQLAAVFPISGGYGIASGCALSKTPAWAFIGQNDTVVPPQDQIDTVNSINACNPPERAKLTILPGTDHDGADTEVLTLSGLGQGVPGYDIYNPSIYDWLLVHSRP
jgi:predicted peptidase